MGFCSYKLLFSYVFLMLVLFKCCYGFGTFGFDIHHRYSDAVKQILAVDGLPEKGSVEYYVAMVHRDRIIRGRGLAAANDQTPLTFYDDDETHRISDLGFLHYANVSVGTPSNSYLVALDTGSDLFWIPCDCTSCLKRIQLTQYELDFNIYNPNASTTSASVPCSSSLCENQCSSASSSCPYQILYLSNGTSSSGYLVEDVLHMCTDTNQSKVVDARVTIGCGQVQTGSFLDGAAPNGLFGLGMDNISVPSTLASNGLVQYSFSMCFGSSGIGRISFGDEGSSDQAETPFNLGQTHPTYNITITQINVGGNAADLEFTAIFDSGTSFTYLNDPAYTLITTSFNSLAKDTRYSSDSSLPFEFCYALSSSQESFEYPIVNMTMKGGDQFAVTEPISFLALQTSSQSVQYLYCLAVVKSGDVNIIGQNFMTGYRIVFNRQKMTLGWTASNCVLMLLTPPLYP
ncbi:Asp domain-containing protein [Cephalotus follicularis]|uniref:Asp domain-containing protein n=1 Tax=Cephalotus follicularis TaxID=3775 RepID=A0A1Q3C3B2_CEPFO|nr:Asp domain-containing protein [Cephalotus follicularis]